METTITDTTTLPATTTQQPETMTTTAQQPMTMTTPGKSTTQTPSLATQTSPQTTTVESVTSPAPSGCTKELLSTPDGTELIYINEGKFAILQCKGSHKFPTPSDGAYFCEDKKWSGDIPCMHM